MSTLLVVIDTCSIAVAPEPTGGFILKLTGIEGLPNTDLLIPVEGTQAPQLLDAISALVNKVPTFTATDLNKEMGHGPN